MFKKTGVVTEERIEEILPSEERRQEGPYAVFECFEEIPCNPCSTACKIGAVEDFDNINERPEIDYEECTGCGLCVSECPGLACFVIDETYSEAEATIKLPYELCPLPEEGQKLDALDRKGEVVCKAEVVKVQSSERLDNTNVITIAVPQEQIQVVRNIGMGGALGE